MEDGRFRKIPEDPIMIYEPSRQHHQVTHSTGTAGGPRPIAPCMAAQVGGLLSTIKKERELKSQIMVGYE